MTTDDYSCIEDVEKIVHIALPFSYAGNQTFGLKSALESWKSQYVKSLEGILISYRKLSFVQSAGRLIFEQPQVHYDVKAIFSVFKPHPGSILKGVVNRISKTHVGCVVHKFVNVSIPLVTDFAHNLTRFLVLDSEVLFKVCKVEIHKRVIRISGEFTKDCIEFMHKSFPHWKNNTHQHFNVDEEEENVELPAQYTETDELINPASNNVVPDGESTEKHNENVSETLNANFHDFNSHAFTSTPFEPPEKKRKKINTAAPMSFLDYNLLVSSIIPDVPSEEVNKQTDKGLVNNSGSLEHNISNAINAELNNMVENINGILKKNSTKKSKSPKKKLKDKAKDKKNKKNSNTADNKKQSKKKDSSTTKPKSKSSDSKKLSKSDKKLKDKDYSKKKKHKDKSHKSHKKKKDKPDKTENTTLSDTIVTKVDV